MTRVLFLSQRIPEADVPSGAGAHVAGTLAGLRERFDVAAVTAAFDAHAVTGRARKARRAVPAGLRGVRRDMLSLVDDRAFMLRALAAAAAFRPDVVYERSEYFAFAGLRVSRRIGVPLVLEVNGLGERDASTMYRSFAQPIGAWIERVKHHRAAAVVTVSTGLARLLADRGADPERTFVVPNTVDPARVLPTPRPVEPQSGTVGFIGHLMPWHREALELLIDVAPGLLDAGPEVRFTVVAGGPGLEELERRATARGVAARFRFTGVIPQHQVPDEMRRFDVGVIPAVFGYAFPVKLVEMGAAGVPVVAPRSRDLDEMLAPGVEYEPFRPGDPEDLSTALRRVLADSQRRFELGAALHRAVRDRYTWRQSGAALAAVIERVAADRHHPLSR